MPAGRPRDPGVRLQEPCLDRSGLRPDPQLHARRRARRGAARRRSGPDEHGERRLADTAYRSAKNEAMLARRGLVSRIHRKKPPGRPMPERMRIANAQKSKVRSAVEHVFAHQKGPMGLMVRTIGIARARVKIGMANLAYNIRRFVWLRTIRSCMTERASRRHKSAPILTAELGRSSRTWRNHACADHSSSRANMRLLEASNLFDRSLIGRVMLELQVRQAVHRVEHSLPAGM